MVLDNLLKLREHFKKVISGEAKYETASGPKPYPKSVKDKAEKDLKALEQKIQLKLKRAHENRRGYEYVKEHPLYKATFETKKEVKDGKKSAR